MRPWRLAVISRALYLIGVSQPREPIFNVPTVVIGMLAVLVAVHILRTYFLTAEADDLLVWNLAFVPGRYSPSRLLVSGWEYGWALWTFITYSFLHADFMHLGFNGVWLLAFGSAVARRFGAVRFLWFYALTAAAGASAHLVTHLGELQPMIGA